MTQMELEQAMDMYQDTVYRIALSYTKNTADAQDISQEVFLQLYRLDQHFPTEAQRRAWLIRVAINLGKNLLHSKWHRIMQQTPETLSDIPASSDDDIHMEQRMWVTAAMKKLARTDRIILHLYYYEEYDTKSIAEILQCKETAVRKRLSRARKRLEKLLGEEEFRYETFQLDAAISHGTGTNPYAEPVSAKYSELHRAGKSG